MPTELVSCLLVRNGRRKHSVHWRLGQRHTAQQQQASFPPESYSTFIHSLTTLPGSPFLTLGWTLGQTQIRCVLALGTLSGSRGGRCGPAYMACIMVCNQKVLAQHILGSQE